MGTIAYVKGSVRLDVRELSALLCKRSIDLKCKLPLYRHGIDMQASQHANVSAFGHITWLHFRAIIDVQYNRIRLSTIAEFVSSDTPEF